MRRVGAINLEVLSGGVPDGAYKAVTSDVNSAATV